MKGWAESHRNDVASSTNNEPLENHPLTLPITIPTEVVPVLRVEQVEIQGMATRSFDPPLDGELRGPRNMESERFQIINDIMHKNDISNEKYVLKIDLCSDVDVPSVVDCNTSIVRFVFLRSV